MCRMRMPWALMVLLLAFAQLCLAQPADRCDVQSGLRRVGALVAEHQDEAGRRELQAMQRCRGLSQLDRFNIGWAYGRMHDYRTALAIFATVDESVPDPATHAYAVALGEVESGNYSHAVAVLRHLEEKQKLNIDCANLLAVAYAKEDRYQDAYTLLREQIREHSHDLYSYLNLITLLSDVGHFAEAESVATEAANIFPQNPEVLIVRGATETLLGRLPKARTDFANALAASPHAKDPRFFLALTDYRLNDFATAETDLRTAMAMGVNSADLEYLLAECILKLEPTKTTEAIAVLDKAIVLDSASVPAHTLRGKLYLEAGAPEKAVADLEKAHTTNPDMRSAAYNLARAYFAVGKREQAQALYGQLQKQTTDSVTELSDRRMRQVLSASQ